MSGVRVVIPWMLLLILRTVSIEAHDLEIGKPFPNLALPSLSDGEPTSVADFGGRKLVLHIWASW